MNHKLIHWNEFLKECVEKYPREVAGFLFSNKPYSSEEEWFIFPVKNIHDNPEEGWIPDRKDMQRIKRKAIKLKLVKIGNVHTHPFTKGQDFSASNLEVEELFLPSEKDLKFARKHNDIIRGIIVCDKNSIYGIKFHDKFGNNIHIITTGVEKHG